MRASASIDPLPLILLLSADEALSDRLTSDLRAAGYAIAIHASARPDFLWIERLQPVLIVVDRLLGAESSLILCRQLREAGWVVPMILLMARDELDDRIACLECGADDYLLKPYRSEALLSMLKLYLKTPVIDSDRQLRFADLVLDLERRLALRGGESISLTMKEFELLKYLMEHPGEVLSREQILENVWGYDFMGESNVIEVYVRYLRLKLEDQTRKRLIQTVRGVGYVLRET